MAKRSKTAALVPARPAGYGGLVTGISDLLDEARRTAARSVNSILSASYWEVGRRIVEFEQGGKTRAEYGQSLLKQLAGDLTTRFGRGFSERNLLKMRSFYIGWEISPTASAEFEARAICLTRPGDSIGQAISPTSSAESKPSSRAKLQTADPECGFTIDVSRLAEMFPLSWSHYVRLISVENPIGRAFYESEAIRGGWSVRQLDRQIATQFFERTAHSKQQGALVARGQKPKADDAVSVEDEIRDPYLLEFLNLKDEYSESELEDALIEHLETFLLELGAGFTFVARQKRIRIGTEWNRMTRRRGDTETR